MDVDLPFLGEEIYVHEMIKCFLLQQFEITMLLGRSVKPDVTDEVFTYLKQVVDTVLNEYNVNKVDFYELQYKIFYFKDFFGSDDTIEFNDGYFRMIFANVDDKSLSYLKHVIKNNLAEFNGKDIINQVVFLYSFNRPLYIALQRTMNNILKRFQYRFLLEKIGVELFTLYDEHDLELLKKNLIYLNNFSAKSYISYMLCVNDDDVKTLLHRHLEKKDVSGKNDKSTIFNEDDHFLLMNLCIRTKKDFFTYSFEMIRSVLMQKKDHKLCKRLLIFERGCLKLVLLAFITLYIEDTKKYHSLYSEFINIISDNTEISDFADIKSFFFRFENESILFSNLFAKIGYFDKKLLESNSLLYISKKLLTPQNYKHLVEIYSNVALLSMSEKEVRNDLSFVLSYGIFCEFLMHKNSISNIIDLLSRYLNNIRNEYILNSVVIDLFSLIFLKDRNDNFVISCNEAVCILLLISPFMPDSSLFNNSNYKLAYANVLASRVSSIKANSLVPLQEALVSNSKIIIDLLNNEFTVDAALQLTVDTEYNGLVHLIQEMYIYQNNVNVNNNNSYNFDIFSLEVFFSYNDDIVNEGNTMIKDEIKQLYIERKKQNTDINITDSKAINKAIESFYSKNYSLKFGNFALFNSLCSYLSLLEKLYKDSLSHSQFFEFVLSSPDIEEEDVIQYIDYMSYELVFQYSQIITTNSKIFDIIRRKHPMIGSLLAIEKGLDPLLYKNLFGNNKQVIKNLEIVNTKVGTFSLNTVESCELYFDYIDDNYLESNVQDLLKICSVACDEQPVNIKLLNNCYERNPLIFNEIDIFKFNLSEIIHINAYQHLKSPHKLLKLGHNFLNIDSIVKDLIVRKELLLLVDFHDDFHFDIASCVHRISEYDTIIISTLRKSGIKILMDIFPSDNMFNDDIHASFAYYLNITDSMSAVSALELMSNLYKTLKMMFNTINTDIIGDSDFLTLMNYISRHIQKVIINNSYEEARYVVLFNGISKILAKFSDKYTLVKKITAVSEILVHFPYTNYNITLDFDNFHRPDKGYFLCDIANRINCRRLINQIIELWNLNPVPMCFHRSFSCFNLFRLKEGVEELELLFLRCKTTRHGVSTVFPGTKSLIDRLVSILTHQTLYNLSQPNIAANILSDKEKVLLDQFSANCANIIAKYKHTAKAMMFATNIVKMYGSLTMNKRWNRHFSITSIQSEQFITLNDIMFKLNERDKLIDILSMFGSYKDAIQLLSYGKNSDEKYKLFSNNIAFPVLTNYSISTFYDNFIKDFPEHSPLIQKYILFLENNSLFTYASIILAKLDCFGRSIYNFKIAYKLSNTYVDRNYICHMIMEVLSELPSKVQNRLFDDDQLLSDEDIFILNGRVKLQINVNNYLITKNEIFDETFELLISDGNSIRLAEYLLLNYEIDMVISFTYYKHSMENIVDRFITDHSEDLLKWVKMIPDKTTKTFQILMNAFLYVMKHRYDYNYIIKFINETVDIEKVKVSLLIEGNYLKEALQICKKRKKEYKDMFKIIASKASSLGDATLEKECLRYVKK